MTKEELIKDQFPNDEFLQSGVLQIVDKCIAELEKENAELKEKLKPENCLKLLAKEGYIKFTSEQLTEAKEIIKNIIRVTWGEGWNYSLDWKVKAEQFISEVEK